MTIDWSCRQHRGSITVQLHDGRTLLFEHTVPARDKDSFDRALYAAEELTRIACARGIQAARSAIADARLSNALARYPDDD